MCRPSCGSPSASTTIVVVLLAAAGTGCRIDGVDAPPIAALGFCVAAAAGWLAGIQRGRRRAALARMPPVENHLRPLDELFDVAPIGVLVAHDPECRTITANRSAAAILGVPADRNISLAGAAPGHALYRVLRDGVDVPPAELPLQRAIATHATIGPEELDVVLPDGRSFALYASAAPVFDRDGRVTGAVGIFLDATERRAAVAAVKASETRLRLAMEAANLDSWEWDLRTGVVQWSRGLVPVIGPSPQGSDLAYEAALEMIHPDDRATMREALGRAVWERRPYEARFRFRLPDGEERCAEIRGKVLCDERGEPARMIGVNFDVTASERHEQERERLLAAERAAREAADRAQRRLRRLVDSQLMGVIFIESGRIVEANEAFLRMLGHAQEDVAAGRLGWQEVSAHEHVERDLQALEAAIEHGECAPYETELVRRDGGRVPVLVGAALLQRESLSGVAFVLDIGARRRAEAERDASLARERAARLEAEAANRTKDDFLAMVTHELRSPLSAIRLWTGVLRMTPPGPKHDHILDEIEASTVAQTRLINDLLDVSRIAAGKLHVELRDVRLDEVVRQALEASALLAAEKQVRWQPALAEDVHVRGDAARLQQVAANLLSNAIKFSRPGGVVEVSLASDAREAVLVVRDHGEGIEADFLPHVFERFRQADTSPTRPAGGLGLGLAIVRHLVEAHGGRIVAESGGSGRGATFTVRLPLREADTTTTPVRPRTHAAPGALAGVRVLVVDDCQDARSAMTAVLETAGAHAASAGSAEEAVRAVEREPPDVVLTDIAMPREDGFSLLRRLRALGPRHGGGVPIAAVTALGGPADRESALACGFQAHLAKPVAPEELVAIVARLARRHDRDADRGR